MKYIVGEKALFCSSLFHQIQLICMYSDDLNGLIVIFLILYLYVHVCLSKALQLDRDCPVSHAWYMYNVSIALNYSNQLNTSYVSSNWWWVENKRIRTIQYSIGRFYQSFHQKELDQFLHKSRILENIYQMNKFMTNPTFCWKDGQTHPNIRWRT